MDLSSISPVLLIASLIVSATPIILAALGETVVEKAGVLNLGVEGMMITGAVVGFAVAINTPASDGIITLSLTNQQTDALRVGNYVYDVEISYEDSNNRTIIERILEGKIRVSPSVT